MRCFLSTLKVQKHKSGEVPNGSPLQAQGDALQRKSL